MQMAEVQKEGIKSIGMLRFLDHYFYMPQLFPGPYHTGWWEKRSPNWPGQDVNKSLFILQFSYSSLAIF